MVFYMYTHFLAYYDAPAIAMIQDSTSPKLRREGWQIGMLTEKDLPLYSFRNSGEEHNQQEKWLNELRSADLPIANIKLIGLQVASGNKEIGTPLRKKDITLTTSADTYTQLQIQSLHTTSFEITFKMPPSEELFWQLTESLLYKGAVLENTQLALSQLEGIQQLLDVNDVKGPYLFLRHVLRRLENTKEALSHIYG